MRNALLAATAFAALALPPGALAQKHELGLMLGRISGPTRASSLGELKLDPGIALQANYSYRVLSKRFVSVSGEIHFLANGQREVRSHNLSATRDVATAFVTPGVRLRFAPIGRFSPYVVGGGGYALYEQSFFQLDGSDNPAPRFTHRGALTFGGGVDTPFWRWVGLRFEIRDFYTGNPSLNTSLRSRGQHNIVVGGGLVVNWGSDE